MTQKNILYLNHISKMGGGEYSLFYLMKNLNRDKYNPILLVQEPGFLSKMANSEGIKTHFLKMRAWRKIKYIPINYMVILPRLRALVKKLNIDLIHCNAYRLNSYAILAAKTINVPCITHIRWFNRKDHIKKFNLDKTDLLIAISNYIASFFSSSSVNVKIIYNGVEVSKFKKNKDKVDKIREEFNIDINSFLVGMIAQLTPRKGHKDFIRASALAKKVLPKTKFLVVGGAILEKQLSIEDLKQYAQQVGADNVIFTGQRNDIVDIFHALDCFVLPSHVEPFGRVILEAMAAKVPVITTRSGGPEEIISDRKNGLLVPVKSPDSIVEKIIELVNNPKFSQQLVESAFKTVSEVFSIERHVNNVEAVYHDFFQK